MASLSLDSASDGKLELQSRLGRAVIAYSLDPHYRPCGPADQERILAQMQKGDARKTRR
jgi:hypothetical protein